MLQNASGMWATKPPNSGVAIPWKSSEKTLRSWLCWSYCCFTGPIRSLILLRGSASSRWSQQSTEMATLGARHGSLSRWLPPHRKAQEVEDMHGGWVKEFTCTILFQVSWQTLQMYEQNVIGLAYVKLYVYILDINISTFYDILHSTCEYMWCPCS